MRLCAIPLRAKASLRAALIGLLFALVAACATPSGVSKSEFAELERAMRSHIEVLASDEFEGRKPGTEGERKTLAYIQTELEQRGLISGTNDPANPWLAPVELSYVNAASENVAFIVDGKRIKVSGDDAFATTPLRRSLLEYASLLYAGADLNDPDEDQFVGQVVVLDGNDPRSSALRDRAFGAGAAAVLQLVDNPDLVATARRALGVERFRLSQETKDALTVFMARNAFADVVGDEQWETLREEAQSEDFLPREIGISAKIEASTQSRTVISHNLVGKIQGNKPGSGAIVLLGHWDHFGTCGEDGDIDRICNGAIDNASGIASLIELADRLVRSGAHDRDIYVLATTAEEWGLLGAKAFIARPPLPLEEIVGVFNFDTVAVAGRGSPVVFLGEGYTGLDPFVLKAIDRSGRDLGSRELAEQFVRRQDGWAFLEAGVPSVMLSGSLSSPQMQTYFQSRYHNAQDNPGELVLSGAVEDMLLHEDLVIELADAERYPAGGE
ncbi:M28 family peptidase [Erythrobacter sp. HA6-11]